MILSSHSATAARPYRIPNGVPWLLALAMLTVSIRLPLAAPSPTTAQPLPSRGEVQPQTLLSTLAVSLGWPTTVSTRPDLPGRALQVSASGDARDALSVLVSTVDEPQERTFLDVLEGQGLTSGLFHGREAIIARAGDPAAGRRGIIAWRCGPHILVAEDRAGQGRELATAEALYRAAETCDLCGIGATLVILAETPERQSVLSLAQVQAMAQAAQRYYERNGYGRVDFGFTFLDADGPHGEHDAYEVAHDPAASGDDPWLVAQVAIVRALAGIDLPEVVYLDRAIVLLASDSSPTELLDGQTAWMPGDYALDVPGPVRVTRAYVPNIVLMPQSSGLGTWVHELGHTLRTQHPMSAPPRRIRDRYPERAREPFSDMGPWDLMARGSRWGTPAGASPTHMSSYTKLVANWLRAVSVEPGTVYTLTAVENQQVGDAVLRLDDPLSPAGPSYYLIEARDGDAPFGAPESGVMIYYVVEHEDARRVRVLPLTPEVSGAVRWGQAGYARPTLHSAADAVGAHGYTLPGNICVRLVAESFRPYRATIHITQCQPTADAQQG